MNSTSPNNPASQPFSLEEIAERIQQTDHEAKSASENSLSKYREIGQALIEAKEHIAKTKERNFGEWVRDNFGYTRGWSAQLMTLAKHWDKLPNAREADADNPSNKPYSVDSAVRLLKAYNLAKSGKARQPKAPTKTTQDLREKLQAAELEIATLKSRIKELECASAAAPRSDHASALPLNVMSA